MVTMCKILAIDAGGTTTRAVIVDRSGRCLGLGLATSGNPVSGGIDAAIAALVAATGRARAAAAMGADPVADQDHFTSAVIAMAGAGLAAPRERIDAALAPLGLRGPVEVVSDVLATYCSGTLVPDGYVLVSGTGAIAARIENRTLVAVSDGLGWLLGDAGSGYWIGHRVASAVTAFLDGRAPQTALTELLLAAVQLPAPQPTLTQTTATQPTARQTMATPLPQDARPFILLQLLSALYARRPVELSRFAPLAFEAGNDEVARSILVEASAALAGTLTSVKDPGVNGPLVLGGSVSTGLLLAVPDGLFADAIPEGSPPIVVPDGIVGAAVLGLLRAGIRVDDDIFRQITDDVAALRAAAAASAA